MKSASEDKPVIHKKRGRTGQLSIEKAASVALSAFFVVALGVFCVGSQAREAASQTQNQTALETTGVTSQTEGATSSGASAASNPNSKAVAGSAGNTSLAGGVVAGSKASSDAAVAGASEGMQSTVIEVVKKKPRHSVSYAWEGAPSPAALLTDSHGVRIFLTLPPTSEVREGETLLVSGEYAKGFQVFSRSESGELLGVYTFNGWNLEGTQTMGTKDMIIMGSWTYQPQEDPDPATPRRLVSYTWIGAPDYTLELFDEQREPITLRLPSSETVREGETFDVDAVYREGTVVRTYNEQGYVSAEYVFGGWNLTGAQVMGTEDVELRGTWVMRVPTYRVSYAWSWVDEAGEEIQTPPEGTKFLDEEGQEVKVDLPDAVEKASGVMVGVDTRFHADLILFAYDRAGNPMGRYEFSGWSEECDLFIEDFDVTIDGTWTYYAE